VNRFKDRPFAVIGVNVNGYEPAKLKEVMDKENLTWRSFVDSGDIVGTWNLPGTPTFYVIDHKGVIRHKWIGSPADYKLGGIPDEKVIDAAIEKLVLEAERK
jgi:peroxiredoxin